MAKKKAAHEDRDLLYIASFILFDALVFQDVVSAEHVQIQPLRDAPSSSNIQDFLLDQWRKILKIDYAPVFTLAVEVLESFPNSPTTESLLNELVLAARKTIASGVLLKHDFMGRLYHKLLLRTTGHYYATYYTSVPAATLLATLSLAAPNAAWRRESLGDLRDFRLIDPACGSGTLLSAAYSALKHHYVLNSKSRLDLPKLHRHLLEEVIHGWDVLDFAAHLTLTTLALHSNTADIRRSNIYALRNGVDKDGAVYLGSLDYLEQQTALQGKAFAPLSRQQSMEENRETELELVEYDLVIMNPPFSRSARPNLKFGYQTDEIRKKMSTRLSDLAKSNGYSGIGQAGLGAFFMLLGLRLSKREGGRLAVVIPRGVLSGVSWSKVRQAYLRDCEIEYVVSNFDPSAPGLAVDPWSWSEETDLGEVLVVARRCGTPDPNANARFVNFTRKPTNEVEALMLGTQVVRAVESLTASIEENDYRALRLPTGPVGTVYQVPQSRLQRNWLAPCVFAQAELNAFALRCAYDLPSVTPIPVMFDSTGSDIKQVKDHFNDYDQANSTPIVWGHQSHMNTIHMSARDVRWGEPKKASASARLHKDNASRFLLAERPHLSTESLMAMLAPQQVLGTAFWEMRPRDAAHTSILLLWFNSTYGVVQLLSHASSSMGDIFKLKKGQMEATPVVDASLASQSVLEAADAVLATLSTQPFLPYAAEFERAAAASGPRYEIDQFFEREMGMPSIQQSLYQMLSVDPVLTKERL